MLKVIIVFNFLLNKISNFEFFFGVEFGLQNCLFKIQQKYKSMYTNKMMRLNKFW